MTFPAVYDGNNNKLVEYTAPRDTGAPTAIMNWMKYLDIDIWRGMDVFEEIVSATATGSGFSGRSVPLLMFLNSCNDEFQQMINGLDKCMSALWREGAIYHRDPASDRDLRQ